MPIILPSVFEWSARIFAFGLVIICLFHTDDSTAQENAWDACVLVEMQAAGVGHGATEPAVKGTRPGALKEPGRRERGATEVSLPWPTVAMGKVHLPFGLEFFMDAAAAKKAMSAWGLPTCHQASCLWTKMEGDRISAFSQTYHAETLTAFGLEYVLSKDEAEPYRLRIEELRRNPDHWVITDLQDPLLTVISPEVFFRAENKDARVEIRFRELEYTLHVALSIQTK